MINGTLEHGAREMGLMLTDDNIKSFEIFAAELKKWNSRLNLTAITKENDVVTKHFLDSLNIIPFLFDEDHLLDIGSGAGFPVIPLKILRPDTDMISVDSVAKKVNFQRHVIRLLGLSRIDALQARVEDLHELHANKFSVITSRAFARLDQFVSLASPLLASGGRLIAMKGADAECEIAASHTKLKELGFSVTSLNHYNLQKNMGARCLVVLMAC